ncbi:UNVERIFIED_ORG: hypothetical protein LHK14_19375 [Roseateles sp. XES5]|nr:hypothetical protein [Roseateles sp. XES5]
MAENRFNRMKECPSDFIGFKRDSGSGAVGGIGSGCVGILEHFQLKRDRFSVGECGKTKAGAFTVNRISPEML